jgi:hypothetical protein
VRLRQLASERAGVAREPSELRCRARKQRHRTVVGRRVAPHPRAEADAARVHADEVKAPMQRGMPQLRSRRLQGHDVTARAAGAPGVDDQAPDPALAVLSAEPVKPEPDLGAARVVIVERDRELAALERRRNLPPAAVPANLAPRLAARSGRRSDEAEADHEHSRDGDHNPPYPGGFERSLRGLHDRCPLLAAASTPTCRDEQPTPHSSRLPANLLLPRNRRQDSLTDPRTSRRPAR